MLSKLQHRGPDDQGKWLIKRAETTIALLHTRLSILDLTEKGHQPMEDPVTGNCIVFNGEIYNYRELRNIIGGGPWISQSDTEVILRAYRKWGKSCLEHLRGMFAFALWNHQNRELFLARDRFGIKPLYYYKDDSCFLFGSELRTLLATDIPGRIIDPVSLWYYLAYQSVPAPQTLVKNIHSLEPGTWLTLDSSGNCRRHQYWDLLKNAQREDLGADQRQIESRVRELLHDAVGLHLVSDVPVAAFLSGGIDSTAVVASLPNTGLKAKTFSIVFSEKAYDESHFSNQVARHFQTEHTEILLREQDLLEQLPDALKSMDQPTGDGINTYVIARAVKERGVKVALSGLGGDELFGGYPSFRRLSSTYMKLLRNAPEFAAALTREILETLNPSITTRKLQRILEAGSTIADVYPVLREVFTPEQREALLDQRILDQINVKEDAYFVLLREAFSHALLADRFTLTSYAEARTYMHDVLLRDTDQMSMAHALEVRVPLLDHKLAEYVMGLRETFKEPKGIPKRLLVQSLNGLIPNSVRRRRKHGFVLPFDQWMKGELRSFCEDRLQRLQLRGIFQATTVQQYWNDFLAGGKNISWSRIWLLAVLDEWLEKNGCRSEA